MDEFIQSILKNLKVNGFPEKKVSFPVEKMYEISDDKGFSFNSVLDRLNSEHGINAAIEVEKVVFNKSNEKAQTNPMEFLKDPNFMQQASEMLKNMDPNQLKQYQTMFENMSEEEKAQVLKKGKDMGII